MEMRERLEQLSDALTRTLPQTQEGRPIIRARLLVQLGQSMVDMDKEIPLADATEETMGHIVALVVEPALALAKTLVRAHFEALHYAMGSGEEE